MKAHTQLMIARAVLLVGVLLTALSSCSSPNAFHNVPLNQPHALLIAEDFSSVLHKNETLVRSINDQPVAFAFVRNSFRIPPGVTVIQPELENKRKHYDPLRFNAAAGGTYHLCPYGKGMDMNLIEEIPGERQHWIAIWNGREWEQGRW
jgi:hypothetical protein